jgi:homoprotocatechuate degradation regulator HpaR
MQLLQAGKSATTLFRPMLHSFDLTDQQWRIIRVLASQQDIETFELSQRSMIPPPSLTRILKNLEEIGLVKRDTDQDDQRKILTNLTRIGRKKYEQVAPESEKIYHSIEKKIGKRELHELLKRLVRLNHSLNNE